MYDNTDPKSHTFTGPSPGWVIEGDDPDECGECGTHRNQH